MIDVDERRAAEEVDRRRLAAAEAACDALGRGVVDADQTDDALRMRFPERELERGARAYGREAAAALVGFQHPAELEIGPTFGPVQADAADELAGILVPDPP